MKLATYCHEGAPARIGVVIGDELVDLSVVAPGLPQDMVGLIRAGQHGLEEAGKAAGRGARTPLSAVRLLAPIVDPPEFLGVGLNYRDHVAEVKLPPPSLPTIFNKQTSCIVGPAEDVVLPHVSPQLDYEGELGIVIGVGAGRHLSRAQAAAVIFGFTVVNDLSVRDWQLSSPTVTLGKSFDTHGPCGPWIVTADELTDPHSLKLTTTINGEVRQQGCTADMIFDCYDIVAYLSRVMTLQAGTLITTGTPAGVGLFHPSGFLRVGDHVSVEISGIGRLDNRVVAENPPLT